MVRISPDEFVARFDDLFQRSAFRLETLPAYVSEAETAPFEQWQRGEPVGLGWLDRWHKRVAGFLAAGKTISRVHIVQEPLSQYLRFELGVIYPANIRAGEDIRIIVTSGHDGWWIPDFWLMDDTACVMDYDTGGNWLGVDLVTDPDLVRAYASRRDHLLRDSIPLADYLGRDSRRTA